MFNSLYATDELTCLVLDVLFQAWNHEFFWESMKPGGGGKPSGELLQMIERDFGSFERFLSEFKSAAATQFGSGWAWLCCEWPYILVLLCPNFVLHCVD